MKFSKLATLVFTLAAAGAVHAQSLTMTANIPFSFVVRGQTMPAGRYSISQTNPPTVAIRQADTNATVLVLASTAEPAAEKGSRELVFHRYGNRYFLARAWVSGQCDTFAPTHLERELSAKRRGVDEVILALR
jgi:hypothetical protein